MKSINKNGSRNIVQSFYYPDCTTVSKEINDEIQRNEDQDRIKIDQSIEAASFHVDDHEQLKINIAEKMNPYRHNENEKMITTQSNHSQEREQAKFK